MNDDNIITFKLDANKPRKLNLATKKKLQEKDDAEVLEAAMADPDALPLTEEQLQKFKPIIDVKSLRTQLHLSQKEFAKLYHLSLATLRDWEQFRYLPDKAAKSFLQLIAAEPDIVKNMLSSLDD